MTRQRNEKSELISASRTLKSFRFVEHSVTKNQELQKKIIYQREMTSSGTRLRFTVIAVNMETEGQVSMSAVLKHWRVFIN